MGEAARTDLDKALLAASRDPTLIEAAAALQANRLAVAERLLRARLHDRPSDFAAIRMLAEVAGRLGRYADAERLLARALELAPVFTAARANYVTVLHRQSKFTAALAEVDRLLAEEPEHPGHLALKAAVLVRTGDYEEAIAIYEKNITALSRSAASLDQLWARAEDRRSADRKHRRIPSRDQLSRYAGRRVVEPRQSENGPVRSRRHRRDAFGDRARADRVRSLPPAFRIGQSTRGCARLCGVVRQLCARQPAAAGRTALQRRANVAARRARAGAFDP